MRETKKPHKGSPPTMPGSQPENAPITAAPSPALSITRQPRTPSQTDAIISNSRISNGNGPGETTPDQWPLSQQPQTPRSIKLESSEMLGSSDDPSQQTRPQPSPVGNHIILPVPSPLDQFKKEDPMEKMAQMTSSLGGGPNPLLSLRSPAMSTSTTSVSAPSTPQGHIPPPSPSMRSQSQGLLPQGQGPMSPQMHLNMVQSPQPPQQMPQQRMSGPPNAGYGQQVPDQPYMQQQSYIYVFNTNLANQAAEAVLRGQVLSIIDFHALQKGTQDFLQQRHANIRPVQRQSSWSGQRPPMFSGQPFPGHRQQMRPQMPPTSGEMGFPPGMNSQGQMFGAEGPQGHDQLTPEQVQMRRSKLKKLDQIAAICAGAESDFRGMHGQVTPPPPYPMAAAVIANAGVATGSGRAPAKPSRPTQRQRQQQQLLQQQQQQQLQQQQAMMQQDSIAGMPGRPPIDVPEGHFFPGHEHNMPMGGMKSENGAPFPMAESMGQHLPFPMQQQQQSVLKGVPPLKEASSTSVMPVPSPQPIQYVNNLDVQEVVIQKQPNRNFVRPTGGAPSAAARGNGKGRSVGLANNPPPMHMQENMPMGMPMNMPQQQQPPFEQMCGPRMPGQPMMQQPNPGNVMPSHLQQQQQQQIQYSQQQQQHSAGFVHSMDMHNHGAPPGMSMPPRMRHPGPGAPSHQMYQNSHFDASYRQQFHPPQVPGLPQQQQLNATGQPQTVNNTYVNAHMTIEQVNISQNLPYETSQYSNSQTYVTNEPVPGGPSRQPGNPEYPSQVFEGSPQIQVRPGAPHTIQYLPTRPPPPKQPRQPPNLDFLQQFATGPGPSGMQRGGANAGQLSPGLPCALHPHQQQHQQQQGGYMHHPGPPQHHGMYMNEGQQMQMQQERMMGGGHGGQQHFISNNPQQLAEPPYDPNFHNFQQQLYASNVNQQSRPPPSAAPQQ